MSHPRDFGLADPDDIGVSEYRAIYENLADALADYSDENLPNMSAHEYAIAILDEFVGWAINMREKVISDKLDLDNDRTS